MPLTPAAGCTLSQPSVCAQADFDLSSRIAGGGFASNAPITLKSFSADIPNIAGSTPNAVLTFDDDFVSAVPPRARWGDEPDMTPKEYEAYLRHSPWATTDLPSSDASPSECRVRPLLVVD